MSWYKVTIQQPTERAGSPRSLQAEFHEIYLAEGEPKHAALFSTREIQNGYRSHYFFSPVAALIAHNLIDRYKGTSCPPPADAEFVVGDFGVADNLFGRPENM